MSLDTCRVLFEKIQFMMCLMPPVCFAEICAVCGDGTDLQSDEQTLQQ